MGGYGVVFGGGTKKPTLPPTLCISYIAGDARLLPHTQAKNEGVGKGKWRGEAIYMTRGWVAGRGQWRHEMRDVCM